GTKVMVVRIDSTQAATTTAAAVFVDEYDATVAGVPLRTVTVPVAVSGSNQPLTMSTSTSEGGLSRSADGRYVTLAGYLAAPGTTTVSSSTSSSVNRVAGRIDSAGTIDTTTRSNNASSGSSVRAATSLDGNAFWISGGAGGIYYS